MRVESRRSTNIATIGRSRPCAPPGGSRVAVGPAFGGSSGVTATSRVGRIWQARRTLGGAWMRPSACASRRPGGGRWSSPSLTRTRQVVQRARPPHTEACGMPSSRIASSRLRPTGATITRPEAWRSW